MAGLSWRRTMTEFAASNQAPKMQTVTRKTAIPRERPHRSPYQAPVPRGSKNLRYRSIGIAPTPPRRGQAGLVLEQALGLHSQRLVSRVADRDQHVAQEAIAADALDGRFRKQFPKRRVVQGCERGEVRCTQFVSCGEFYLASGLREFVPWADRKTIVTSIDAVTDRLAKFVRDRSLVHDGEIGNAAARIELVRRRKGGGRAD